MNDIIKDPTTWGIVVTLLYEVAVRVVPTVKDYTIVGKIIKGLKWLHENLNRVKPS